jgi:S-adenosylmethionine-diacylgycerolhomoserine-N-methlytransferase
VNARALDPATLGTLFRLLRGQPRTGSHAANLQAFYAPQAAHYDTFRTRLLAGRQELIDRLALPDGATVVELGGGTGQNLDYFGNRLARLGSVTLVDLCPALLAQARRRAAARPNVRIVEADATRWQPDAPVDCVYFSYALTMIPDWSAALDNAFAMLKPGGMLGAVDFYVSAAAPPRGQVRHDVFTRHFWPRWFAHDGVRPTPAHLDRLRVLLPCHTRAERRAALPWLPGLRAPWYLFVGRRL